MKLTKSNTHKYLQFKNNAPYRRFVQKEATGAVSADDLTKGESTDHLTHGTYGGLLFHPKWKEKRKEILDRDSHRCVICKSDKELQVHHRQYHFIVTLKQFRLPWEYADSLLITLCESCHSRGHSKYTVPTINV